MGGSVIDLEAIAVLRADEQVQSLRTLEPGARDPWAIREMRRGRKRKRVICACGRAEKRGSKCYWCRKEQGK